MSISFSFTDEQTQFRDTVRRFFDRNADINESRRLMESETGFDPAVWQRMTGDLGLGGVHLPEACGGAGFGATELGIVMEEAGRTLVCAPLLGSTVLAASAIATAATAAERDDLLPPIAAGDTIAALALAEADGQWDPQTVSTSARAVGDGYRLHGEKKFVIDGMAATQFVVVAQTDAGISLFLVSANAAGLERRALSTLDRTRRQAALRFNNAEGRLLGAPGAGGPAVTRTIDFATIALAHEMVGGADALLRLAVDYAGIRMQFGRVIGSFQAVKHKCADLLLAVELARSAAYYAAAAYDAGDPEISALTSTAKALAADAYMRAATDCIQIHGGIGFTWDHDAHLYYRRAKSSEVLFGDARFHRERYLACVAASR